jgi:hypothetical protein
VDYRGIQFTVRPRGDSNWGWEIYPPTLSVTGWKRAQGEIQGTVSAAMRAARDEIDRQCGTPEKREKRLRA